MENLPQKQPGHFKSFWPIVFIATVSAIVGGIIVWFAFDSGLNDQINSLTPGSFFKARHNNEQNGSSADIKDWKTYRNDEYGFSFEYPAEWKLNILEAGGLKAALPMRLGFEKKGDLKILIEADYHTFDYAESHMGFDGSEEIFGRGFSYVKIDSGLVYYIAGTGNRTFFVELRNLADTGEVKEAKQVISTLHFSK